MNQQTNDSPPLRPVSVSVPHDGRGLRRFFYRLIIRPHETKLHLRRGLKEHLLRVELAPRSALLSKSLPVKHFSTNTDSTEDEWRDAVERDGVDIWTELRGLESH